MVSIPLQLFKPSIARRFRILTPLARRLCSTQFTRDCKTIHMQEEPDSYVIAFMLSAFIFSALISGLMFFLQVMLITGDAIPAIPITLALFASFFVMFFYILMIYPSILAKKAADTTNRLLLHVVRDMWIQSTSGVPLYSILNNISKSDYGIVSDDMRNAARQISAGESELKVLEKAAESTRADTFKQALLQMTSAMRTGLGLTSALESSIGVLTAEQYRKVKEYGSSLNFYLLLYLMFAAVIPAVVITFVSLLSIFGVFEISLAILLAIVGVSIAFQLILIGFMRVGRPEV